MTILTLTYPNVNIQDIEEHDSDSIHSFDLDDISSSVSSSLALFDRFASAKFEELDDAPLLENDHEIERILTPWGQDEYQNFQRDIKCVKKQENGLYLSGN